jgi:lipopolysaccharide transport system ATP-binding protein
MSEHAVLVEGLGKKFRIGGKIKPYKSLRESLAVGLMASVDFARRLGRRGKPSEYFWALRDVNFNVSPGEVVGIIGRNGAGKSTLLKILSRITEPTEGRGEIHGRVGSLLEVGTGFHAELTGRENLYLNGAILGMKRTEIDRKFDAIVAFAEVERFIDTPVKHYSSGMYLRLAFAVAAHLEPEILIVDEVLAVGDASFQKRCLNKMQDVGREGRTVLFVSHNMPAITRLCDRAILLDGGRVVQDGPSGDVVGSYLKSGFGTMAVREWRDDQDWPGGGIAGLQAVRVRDESGRITDNLDIRRPIRLEMEFEVWTPDYVLMPYFLLSNEEGIVAFHTNDLDPEWRNRRRPLGRYVSTAWIPGNYLAEGTMFVTAGLTTLHPDQKQFLQRDVVAFQVVDSLDGDSARGDWAKNVRGVVRPLLQWTTSYRPVEAEAGVAPGRSER